MVSGALELDFAEKAFPKSVNWSAISFLALGALAYAMLAYSLGEGDCVYAASSSPRKPSHVFALETARSNVQQLYLVVVHTGHRFNAGTSAAVSFVLHGEMGSSEVVDIGSCGSDVLHRGSKNAFLIGTNVTLGNLTSIEVWHDNSGKSPSWFLEDVVVTDCRAQNITRFEFNSWFSVACKDGQTKREAFVSCKDPSAFKALCESLAFALHDHHLWNSIAMMNKCSFLSRCQRLTLCLSTVLLSSALSALRVFLMDAEPATDGAFPDGLTVQRVTEAAIVCAVVHFVHHIPATVWRHFECATLPRKVWAASKPVLAPLLSAVSVWNKQASDVSSYSSARHSLQSNRVSADSESDASMYDAKDEPPGSSDNESLPSSPSDKDEEGVASSGGPGVTGYQDDDVQEPGSNEMVVVAASRGPSSLLEGALANLADFQRRVREKESTATGNPSETVERSRSPSLGDSDLTCLDFDTNEDVIEDESSFGLLGGNRSGGHPSGTAYKVPSLPMGSPNWATWVMGSVGWLVLAGLIVGSGFILVGRTHMFLAAANALCFQMTTLAVLLSIFVAYPLQALVVSVFVTVCSRRSQKSLQSAFPALPCACNVVLQQLFKRVSRRPATLPTPSGQWRGPARRLICDRTAGSRPNGSSGKRVLRRQRGQISASDRTAVGGGNRPCHRAWFLTMPKLVTFRKRCLVGVAAFKPTSYCISSLVLTIVLLTHMANESMEHGYRQHQSITGFVSSLNQQMMEGECDVNKPIARDLRPVLCAKAESEELFLHTGSVLLRHGQMCTKQGPESEAMTKCAQGQTKLLRFPARNTCITSFQRYYKATRDTTPQPAVKFELYNPALQIVSSVRVQLQCQCNQASFCASVTVCHLRGSSTMPATGFLELCLFVIICWKLSSLAWRRLKMKQPLVFQFWDIHELSVAVCSLCYWTCWLFRRSYQREVFSSLYDEGKDLPTAIEALSACESASRCLLGTSLFLAGLGVVRVLYASRHQPAFCFVVLPKSLGKQLAVLATSWLFLLASTCCLSPAKKGTGGLVRFTGAMFGRLFGIHQASSGVCDGPAGNHTAIELFELSVALLGTLVMLSFAVRLLMGQRFGKKLTSPDQTHRDLTSQDKAISQFSRTGVNVKEVNTKQSESEKLLLLVEELTSKMEEKASRLFTIPSEEECGGQQGLCNLE